MSKKNKEKKNKQSLQENIAAQAEQPDVRDEADDVKTYHEKKRIADNVIEELFSQLDKETDIESDVADLGTEEEAEEPAAAAAAEDPKKRRLLFGFAIFVVIMALIGVFASVRFIIGGISSLMENKTLKDEFTKFLLPVAANDIAPFSNEGEISQPAKVGCSIWNILLNKDINAYKKSDSSELLIPEYDVEASCKELFGADSQIVHQSTGSTDTRFIYSAVNHVYTCTYNLRYLSYTPNIASMNRSGSIYTLIVEYIPPSISIVSQNIGMEVSPEKTMTYSVRREGGKNTLESVSEIREES